MARSEEATRHRLRPEETRLVGAPDGPGPRELDIPAIERINFLRANVLREIARVDQGWTFVLQDPGDGRFWLLSRLEGHTQGGGYPEWKTISADEAGRIVASGGSDA